MTRRYLLDTGIAGHYMDRRNGVYDRARDAVSRGGVNGIGTPVLGELVYGAEYSASPEKALKAIERARAGWRLWNFDEAAAREYGRLAALLRRTGRSMQQIDIQIAAIALTLGNCTVVSSDSDLSAVPGLTVENWAAP
jgi:tRNA(fMet)-specific endonuclease VapC